MGYKETVKREIKNALHRPIIWVVSFILPLLMCFLICIIFQIGTPKDLPIAVLNQDNSNLSRMIIRNINSLPSVKVEYEVNSLAEGEEQLRNGNAYGFIVIPKNFQTDIYKLKQPKIVYYYNNQRILAGGIITKDITLVVQSMLVGIDAKIKNKTGLPMKEAIKQSNLINVIDHVKSNPYFNYQYFLSLVAFGHILQIHLFFTIILAIGTEFKKGKTKEWLEGANNSIIIAILGKTTPYLIIFITMFTLLYLTYFIVFNVPYYGNILMGGISTLLFIFTCCSMGFFFISLNGNLRYALSNAAFYTAMGFAFAGITYPVMSMPKIAQLFSATMPINYWVKIMIDQSLRQIPIVYDIKYLLSLFVITFIGLCFLPRLKSLCLNENRWYQE